MPRKEKTTNYFRLGLFVTAGLCLMTTITLLFGFDKFFRKTVTYVTYFEKIERNLQQGSTVYYMGMQAGAVDDLELHPTEHKTFIKVTLKLNSTIKVTSSTRVMVNSPLIVGPAFLEIIEATDTTPSSPRLPFKPPENYIRSVYSTVDKYKIQLEDIIQHFITIDIASIQKHLVAVMSNISVRLQDKQIDSTIQAIGILAQESIGVISNVSVQIENEELAEIIHSLQVTSSNLVLVSSRFEKSMKDDRVARISKNIDDSLIMVPAGIEDTHSTIIAIRQLTTALERLIEQYERDPSAVIFGDPLPKTDKPGKN